MKLIDDERNVFVTAENFESLERQAISEWSWITGYPEEQITLEPLGMEYVLRARDEDNEIKLAILLWFRY